jgi:hypothetical protein
VQKLLPDANGKGPFFFTDFPQFLGSSAGGLEVIDSNSFSNYHGAVARITRHFEQGLDFNVSYTFSKSLDDKSYDPTFTRISSGTGQSAQSTPFDAHNRRLNYAPSDFDRTHALQGGIIYELPFGPGKRYFNSNNGVVRRLLGGWTVTTGFTWASGLPFTVVAGQNTFSNRNVSRANYSGSNFHPQYHDDPTTGVPFLFTAEERAQFTIPGPGEIGNTGRNAFRMPSSFNMDASIIKRIPITERKNFELRAEAFNLTNTVYLGFPGNVNVANGSTFSRDLFSDSSARVVQVAFKFNF